MLVEARGDEEPELLEDDRARHEDARDQRDVDVEHERLGQLRVGELRPGRQRLRGPASRGVGRSPSPSTSRGESRPRRRRPTRRGACGGPRGARGTSSAGAPPPDPRRRAADSVTTRASSSSRTGARPSRRRRERRARSAFGARRASAGRRASVEAGEAFSISSSIVRFSSFEVRLNSPSALPTCLPISGSFFGPKRSSARTRIMISSGIPRLPIAAPPLRRGENPAPPEAMSRQPGSARQC